MPLDHKRVGPYELLALIGAAAVVLMLVGSIPVSVAAQSTHPNFDGMWSDPPSTAVGQFCFFNCSQAGIDYLNVLLDNPANDKRPYTELDTEAKTYEREKYIVPRLTAAALKTFPLDPADDPGFLRCEPWGLARQMFAPHQLEIRQRGNDRIEFRYGEWDARRTIDLDGRKRPSNQAPSRFGHSVGRWDGEALVVETSGIAANIAPWLVRHSDKLRVTERFTRSQDGKILQLTATIEDPETLREPLVLKKIWRWAPDQKITPYVNCERPTEFKRGVK